jgi:serine/threonine protein phosphatase PrpC
MNHPQSPPHAFAWALDPGRARRNNEDAVSVDAPTGIAVLADGMGGYNAGEVASAMATTLCREHLAEWRRSRAEPVADEAWRDAIQASVSYANRAIFDAANGNPQYQGMGATLVMAAVSGSGVWIGHIGDSRAYRHDGRVLSRLTRDHSLLQEQIDAGLITPQQAARSNYRNFVTRAVGVEAWVDLELHHQTVAPHDVLLLCSDGVTDMLDDATIASHLQRGDALDESAQGLVDAANAAGGKDNISVILIRIGG